jgi:hypothetical protein
MRIEEGQVFVVDCARADGTADRSYYRSDGHGLEGQAFDRWV